MYNMLIGCVLVRSSGNNVAVSVANRIVATFCSSVVL